MNLPTALLQNALAPDIASPSGPFGVIRFAVAFDTEHVSSLWIGMDNSEINTKTAFTDL